MHAQHIYLKNQLKRVFTSQAQKIEKWLADHPASVTPPIYASVDIRDAGFKAAIVDKNLFPAGFNNLCEKSQEESSKKFRSLFSHLKPQAETIGIIAEDHTRNLFYLNNISVLKNILEKAGYHVDIHMSIPEPRIIALDTKAVSIKPYAHAHSTDILLLNNDLSNGIPEDLANNNGLILPPVGAGWHRRKKSKHFELANNVIKEFATYIDSDPWLMSCLYRSAQNIDIHNDSDRIQLADLTRDLLKEIQAKYDEYDIKEKPFVFVKSDSGTYGMGIQTVEDANELLDLNRKKRNKLDKGKHSLKINHFLIQEGIPSSAQYNNSTSETCIYQVGNDYMGSFLRVNNEKGSRDNLNSKGMNFAKVCHNPVKKLCPTCDTEAHPDIDMYITLAKLSGIAASQEVEALELKA